MTIKFGGKTADEIVSAEQQKQFAIATAAGRIKDPLPLPSGTENERLSILGDLTLWTEQLLDEMSALARKHWRLRQKLKDPELQTSPSRPKALVTASNQEQDLLQAMTDIVNLEAKCDRLWQSLTPNVRGKYGMDWGTDPNEPRLIGKSWQYKAHQFKWPKGYFIESTLFRRVDPYLKREIDDALGGEIIELGEQPEW